jgi:5-methyltetrahydrofolate--homocysteine methyltransferase
LNCATGPTEMSEHLRYLSKYSSLPISVMPNAGLPILSGDGAYYPLGPIELAAAQAAFVREFGAGLIGGCCGTTPAHINAIAKSVVSLDSGRPSLVHEPGLASLYQHQPFDQDMTYFSIGERTNANGSKAFRDAMLVDNWDECVEIAKAQTRDGAHALDVCVDYVGRDGVADMAAIVSRLATSSTLPLVLDSTEPAVLEAGLENYGGRALINSVNYEDGEGPNSRFAKIMPLAREHGAAVVALTIDEEGQARTSPPVKTKLVATASRQLKQSELCTRSFPEFSQLWGSRIFPSV